MDWQVDFTHMPSVKKIKYLLVLVDTFTGWVEAFPTTNKRASTVTKILVTDIIPQFGLLASIQSDNGPVLFPLFLKIWHKPYTSTGDFTSPITPNPQARLSLPITHSKILLPNSPSNST
jgi:hypothetical protein